MEADEAVYLLRRFGLTLEVDAGRLIVTPANLIDDDTRWLVRTHKAGLIAELADVPRWAWLVHFNGYALETFHHPDATRADVVRKYPGAVRITPLYRPAVEMAQGKADLLVSEAAVSKVVSKDTGIIKMSKDVHKQSPEHHDE